MRNRRIVVRNEAAGHPFRKMLPPPIGGVLATTEQADTWWKREDTHLFLMSFIAFFIVFSSFIA